MKYIYLLLFAGFSMSSFGQSKKAFLEAALKAEMTDNHYAALSYYNEALEFNKTDEDILFKSAEAARQWNALSTAERKYSMLIDTLNSQAYPDARFYLGEVRQKLGKYDAAKMDYELYLSENEGDDELLTAKAQKEIASIEYALSMQDKIDESIKLERLSDNINSPYSDFGAIKVNEDLYYTSLRYDQKDPKEKPAKLISKILFAEGGSNGDMLEGEINMDDQPIAHTTFNADKSRIYYTLCEYTNDAELRCDIFFRTVNPDGTMGSATSVGPAINDTLHTSTQPNIATDLITGEETLYFVSDRTGGKGNLDIWSATINEYGFAENPINLSSINTAQNDITPFFHNPTRMLYFSSRGYLTLGGYDVFVSQMTIEGYTSADNLGLPTNSSFDDAYYTINDAEDEALFSSNRLGSNYIDNEQEACCFDIYKEEIENFDLYLDALTIDYLTNADLYSATVRLIDEMTGEELGSITNDEGNSHVFPLKKNREYIVIGEKDKYYPDTITLSTKGISSSDTIIRKLFLDSDLYALDITTYDLKTKEDLIGATVMLIDVSGEEPNVIEINKISNDFHFMLDPNKNYKIVATRPDYQETTLFINTIATDNKGGRIITKEMYLLKPELDTYLPLALYFDNDEPDPNSRSTNTDKIYSALHNAYMARKSEFINQYGSDDSEGGSESNTQAVESFFEGEVASGYNELQTMMSVLLKELTLGQKIEISIRGYASPRFDTKYNLVLGQRRVTSVKNEMLNYENGALRPFINSGKLKIIDVSFGEELAPSNINDNINNKKLSIYSPEASKERRVEIISATKNKY